MAGKTLVGIYDFELLPYALGDVLTWNVKTAIQCEEAGREAVDIYVCNDAQSLRFMFQRQLIDEHNAELFFYELYGAFGTNPRLQNLHIFRSKESLIETLHRVKAEDDINAGRIANYLAVLKQSALTKNVDPALLGAGANPDVPGSEALVEYFTTELMSHRSINAFAKKHGRIPLLQAPAGCAPDVEQFIERCGQGKRIVPFHFRFRQLDLGYGGAASYARDASFIEWIDFLIRANEKHPEVLFVALGRVQEKPLEILRLPNVSSLRMLGMGLGHELALMLQSDFFVGMSSGFAAFANFTAVPYFIVKVTRESYLAYDIPFGSRKLPFAFENQELIDTPDRSDLLLSLLERGLRSTRARAEELRRSPAAAVVDNERTQLGLAHGSMTTSRFFVDDGYRTQETARALLSSIQEAKLHWFNGELVEARRIASLIDKCFPALCWTVPQYLILAGVLAIESSNTETMGRCLSSAVALTYGRSDVPELLQLTEVSIAAVLTQGRESPDFSSRYGELKAKLQHADLRRPLSAKSPLLDELHLLADVHEAKERWLSGDLRSARRLVEALIERFPNSCWKFPQYLAVAGGIATDAADRQKMHALLQTLYATTDGQKEVPEVLRLLQISMLLALTGLRRSPIFVSRYAEFKAKFQGVDLRLPLTPVTVRREHLERILRAILRRVHG